MLITGNGTPPLLRSAKRNRVTAMKAAQERLVPGQLVGLGGNNKVWLYVKVKSFESGILHGWVINGEWGFHLNTQDGCMVIHTPGKDTTACGEIRIIYTGDIPTEIERDYNAAIQFMNEYLSKCPHEDTPGVGENQYNEEL